MARSFRIAWNHKYLWLIAFFSGEAGANYGFNSSYAQRQPSSFGSSRAPDFGGVVAQVGAWIQDNLGLILLLLLLCLVLVVGFFILAAACEGATVRAAAEHDVERSFGLRAAWQAGVSRLGAMLRFRLLLIGLGLPVFLVVFGLVAGATFEALSRQVGAAIALAALAVLVFLVAIPYAIYLFFLDRLGSRVVMLELLNARPAIVRAHRLVVKRLGRVLLLWLLAIAVAIVIGIGLGIVVLVAFLPAIVLVYSAATGAASWFWAVLAAAIALPVALVLSAFFAAQSSTYWTLAFRRLDLDPSPAFTPNPAPSAP